VGHLQCSFLEEHSSRRCHDVTVHWLILASLFHWNKNKQKVELTKLHAEQKNYGFRMSRNIATVFIILYANVQELHAFIREQYGKEVLPANRF
jgi:hypothetical protein